MKMQLILWCVLGLAQVFSASTALAENTSQSQLSFIPPKPCFVPPQAPQKSLLEKKYKVGNFTTNIFRADLNGDGICNWVRDGFTQSRYDQEENEILPLKDFVFIGTKKGWRYIGAEKNIKSNAKENKKIPRNFKVWWYPIAAIVYDNNSKKPFIVSYSAGEGWPTVPRNSYFVFQWNDERDFFTDVNPEAQERIMKFIEEEFCTPNPKYSIAENVTYVLSFPAPDALCKK